MRATSAGCLALALASCGPSVPDLPGPGEVTGPCLDGECDEWGTCVADMCRGDPYGDDLGRSIQLTVNRDVDLLFVIDNSRSMGRAQGVLAAGLPELLDVLETPRVDANYRIGFTTTDNGNPWCPDTSPEAGKLQLSSCRGRADEFVFDGEPPVDATAIGCTDHCMLDAIATRPTTTDRDPLASPRPWIERIQHRSNLAETDGSTPTIAEALQCALPQGIAGCGFESHLESMYKTLLRAVTPGEAELGFVRPNAVLAIVLVSDEVDCSYVPAFESIFLGEAQGGNPAAFWSDPAAEIPTSAVCWHAGVTCTGEGYTYDECHADNKDVDGNAGVPDEDAVLHPIGRYVEALQFIEDLKQTITPNQEVIFAAITGVSDDYAWSGEVDYHEGDELEFGIGPGCIDESTEPNTTARPPVREREVAESLALAFAPPNLHSICTHDLSPALGVIANAIADQLLPTCMPACVADDDPDTEVVDPVCTLIQEAPNSDGRGVDESEVQPCNADGSLPGDEDVCWVALGDPFGAMRTPSTADDMSLECTEKGWNLEFRIVRRDGVPAPPGTSISADCWTSFDKSVDCPALP